MSFAISRSVYACALLSCLLAAAAHAGSQSTALPAANPDAPVPPTRYQSSTAYQPLAAEPATPDQAWREQNRIVGAGPGRDHTTHGHAGHAMPQAAPVDPHAGHAGHAMPQAAPVDPHAGHAMPAAAAAAAADPHAGHTMPVPAPAPAQADPHAGHAMHHAAPAPAAHQHEEHH